MIKRLFFKETNRSRFTCYFVTFAGIALLVISVIRAPQVPIYDERIYLQTIEIFEQYGLSFSFLRNWEQQGGPLYAILHSSLAPLTHLDILRVRLLNISLFGLTIFLTIRIGYLINLAYPVLWSLCMVSIPMTWVLSGMALTC